MNPMRATVFFSCVSVASFVGIVWIGRTVYREPLWASIKVAAVSFAITAAIVAVVGAGCWWVGGS